MGKPHIPLTPYSKQGDKALQLVVMYMSMHVLVDCKLLSIEYLVTRDRYSKCEKVIR